MTGNQNHFTRNNSCDRLTIQSKIFMVHIVLVIEARPFLPYCAHFLTDVGDNLVYDHKYWVIYGTVTFSFKLPKYYYLKSLFGETAAWTAGTLDPECWCSFCITHFQERSEHAPPGNAVRQLKTHLYTRHATGHLAKPLGSLLPSLVACLVTVQHTFLPS